VAQQVIALGDQLHVGVLDAVVDHLDVMTGAVGADVGAARRPVDVGGDRLEDRLDRLVVGLTVAAGHDARPVQRALLTARDPDTEEVDPLLGQGGMAALRVSEVAVAAVDQDVPAAQVGGEVVDHGVGRVTCLDHAHQGPRRLERADPILGRLVAGDRALGAVLVQKPVHAAGGPVVHRHRDLVMGHVARQVGAHRGKSGQAEVSVRAHHQGS